MKVAIPKSDKGFDVSQIADFERVIPLETADDALIGEIDKLEMDDSHIVILDKRMRTVWPLSLSGTLSEPHIHRLHVGRQPLRCR